MYRCSFKYGGRTTEDISGEIAKSMRMITERIARTFAGASLNVERPDLRVAEELAYRLLVVLIVECEIEGGRHGILVRMQNLDRLPQVTRERGILDDRDILGLGGRLAGSVQGVAHPESRLSSSSSSANTSGPIVPTPQVELSALSAFADTEFLPSLFPCKENFAQVSDGRRVCNMRVGRSRRLLPLVRSCDLVSLFFLHAKMALADFRNQDGRRRGRNFKRLASLERKNMYTYVLYVMCKCSKFIIIKNDTCSKLGN